MIKINEWEVIERELWGIPLRRAREIRSALKTMGFLCSKECWYHPNHWRVERYDWDAARGRYCVNTEAFIPLTSRARTFAKLPVKL
jgi:hypothetical protein